MQHRKNLKLTHDHKLKSDNEDVFDENDEEVSDDETAR